MKLTLIHYALLVGVALIFFVVYNRRSSPALPSQPKPQEGAPGKNIVVDSTPDTPAPFGPKCVWYAVKTTNTADILTAVGLQSAVRSNWRSGLDAAYDYKLVDNSRLKGRIFVSPPVNGWTLLVGMSLPCLENGASNEKTINLLKALSGKFGEAQYFGTHRVSSWYSWARALDGSVVRAYSFGDGEILANQGEVTLEERQFGVSNDAEYYPNEETVWSIAGAWSLNPTKLDEIKTQPASGWLGDL